MESAERDSGIGKSGIHLFLNDNSREYASLAGEPVHYTQSLTVEEYLRINVCITLVFFELTVRSKLLQLSENSLTLYCMPTSVAILRSQPLTIKILLMLSDFMSTRTHEVSCPVSKEHKRPKSHSP